jgi:hypothetical protein
MESTSFKEEAAFIKILLPLFLHAKNGHTSDLASQKLMNEYSTTWWKQ